MLSSATLFHFVPKLDYLLNNIENGVFPTYCEEHVPSIKGFEKLFIPMTCFCDIPLSSISDHINCYGKYGIGVTKEWAMKHGISPIIYTYDGAETSDWFNARLKGAITQLKAKYPNYNDTSSSDFSSLFEKLSKHTPILTYMKPYKGDMDKRLPDGTIKTIHDKVFYDEKEWRFVPKTYILVGEEVPAKMPIIPKALGNDYSYYKTLLDDAVEKGKAQFTIKLESTDIKYLFTPESDRLALVKRIGKSPIFPDRIKLDLISKIVTIEQIKSDF